MKLKNQVALVTGAAGGIGSEICRGLAQEGASIVLHYYSRQGQCLSLKEELEALRPDPGQQFVPACADLLQDSEVRDLVHQAKEKFQRLDILVNNAGWSRHVTPDNLDGLDEELFHRTTGLKINAPLYLARACKHYLSKSPAGQIINITSVAGIASRGSSIVYAAANAALSCLTKSLARSLAPDVRVNAVAPGFLDTGFVWPQDGKAKEHVSKQNHIGRCVEPGEVARLVLFLACDAPSITGEEIAIDGGIGRLGKK